MLIRCQVLHQVSIKPYHRSTPHPFFFRAPTIKFTSAFADKTSHRSLDSTRQAKIIYVLAKRMTVAYAFSELQREIPNMHWL